MKKPKPRKPRGISNNRYLVDIDDSGERQPIFTKVNNWLEIEEAKRLHAWLGKAILYLEGKKS